MKGKQFIPKIWSFQIAINLLFWICMYVFWLGFNYNAFKDIPFDIFFTLVDFVCFGFVSFLTNTKLIPAFLYKKRYLNFLVIYLILIFVVTTIMLQLNFWMQAASMSSI